MIFHETIEQLEQSIESSESIRNVIANLTAEGSGDFWTFEGQQLPC